MNGLAVDNAHGRFVSGEPLPRPLGPASGQRAGREGRTPAAFAHSNHRGHEGVQLLRQTLEAESLFHYVSGGVAALRCLQRC